MATVEASKVLDGAFWITVGYIQKNRKIIGAIEFFIKTLVDITNCMFDNTKNIPIEKQKGKDTFYRIFPLFLSVLFKFMRFVCKACRLRGSSENRKASFLSDRGRPLWGVSHRVK